MRLAVFEPWLPANVPFPLQLNWCSKQSWGRKRSRKAMSSCRSAWRYGLTILGAKRVAGVGPLPAGTAGSLGPESVGASFVRACAPANQEIDPKVRWRIWWVGCCFFGGEVLHVVRITTVTTPSQHNERSSHQRLLMEPAALCFNLAFRQVCRLHDAQAL